MARCDRDEDVQTRRKPKRTARDAGVISLDEAVAMNENWGEEALRGRRQDAIRSPQVDREKEPGPLGICKDRESKDIVPALIHSTTEAQATSARIT
eukprot:9535970-Alexandrium_andersonii.AAC.1